MKGKKEIIGVIPKEKVFQAEKPKHEVRFKTGYYKTDKDRPRKKYKPHNLDDE